MGFGSMIFGDPERKRREKREREQRQQQERSHQKEINQAYLEAKIAQRKKNAVAAGIADANKLANRKPFYQKVIGFGTALGKDIIQGASKTNPDVFFNWDDSTPKRRKRKRRKK
jgi:hypothetical protein